MHQDEQRLTTGLRLPDGRTVEDCLLHYRRMEEFIGRHLPFSLTDDRTGEPVRYHLGDEWLDLMVLYEPDQGWDVQVLARSSGDVRGCQHQRRVPGPAGATAGRTRRSCPQDHLSHTQHDAHGDHRTPGAVGAEGAPAR